MPRPDVSAERIPQILQAALRVFSRQGFPATRMKDIAAEAGLSVGILYHYFEDKEALVQALLKQMFLSDVESLQTFLRAGNSLRERLWQYIESRWFAEYALFPLSLELRALAVRYPPIHSKLQEIERRYLENLTVLVGEAIARGELRPAEPRTIALTLLAWYDGVLENMAYASVPENEARRLLRQSFDLLFDGLTVPQQSA